MKELFNSLTFYNSTDKQDYNRTKALIPVYSARHYLPPFMISLGTDSIGTIDRIELIDKDGNQYNRSTGMVAWENYAGTWDSFTSNGLNILSAIDTTGNADLAKITTTYNAKVGETIRIRGFLTINSGATGQQIHIYEDGTQNVYALSAGWNSITHTFTTDCVCSIYFSGPFAAENISFTQVTIGVDLINELFPTLPAVYTSATLGDYIQYKGDTLNYLLPLGLYYIKITADDYVYVSDYIMIDDIYPPLAKTLTNSGYETFTASGTTIIQAISTSGADYAITESFQVKKGESIKCILNLTLTSGTLPYVYLINQGWTTQDAEQLAEGLNEITLTATWSGTAYIIIYNESATCNFSTSEIHIIRSYSENYTKITFTNTNNVGKLLYEDDLIQSVLLPATLNNPTHEMVTVGEEKDGIFIAEKMISKYIYTLIARVSRAVYSALSRLPLHDTITITDETGNVYSPAVGNVTVDPPEWEYYDTSKITIRFNNGDESSFVWTK